MLVTIRLQIQHIAEALGKRTIEQRLLMMSNPESCIMIKFNVSNGNPVRTPLAALTSSDLSLSYNICSTPPASCPSPRPSYTCLLHAQSYALRPAPV